MRFISISVIFLTLLSLACVSFSINVSNCSVISAAGIYSLNQSVSGAPNPSSLGPNACILVTSSNVTFNCSGFSITNNGTGGTTAGILFNGPLYNATVMGCPNVSGYTYGIYLYQSNNSNVTNNTARNNSQGGFEISSGSGNSFSNNNAYNNSDHGFFLSAGSNNSNLTNNSAYNNLNFGFGFRLGYNLNITNNSAYNNTVEGFYLDRGSSNTFINNRAYNHTYYGFDITAGTNFNFSGNTAYSNLRSGFQMSGSGHILTNNTASMSGAGYAGFYASYAANTSLYNNTACNNTFNGFYSFGSTNLTFRNNTACNNVNYGTDLEDTNATLAGEHYYNNSADFRAYSNPPAMMNLTSVIFDSTPGAYQNFTNLSLNTTYSSSGFEMEWSNRQNSLSIRQKVVTISRLGAFPSFDSISWSWTDAETTGYNESAFELWRYNASGWSLLNSTPSTTLNTLSLAGLSDLGDFAILTTNCPVITSPGTYELMANSAGAPNSASPVAGNSCVKIAASNVILDCMGFNITHNNTPTNTHGILLNGSLTNVTVRNCPSISGYANGIYIYQSNNSNITNNTAWNNSFYGFYLESGRYNLFFNNTARSNTYYGFYLITNSYYNALANNTAHSNSYHGFYLWTNSLYNNLTNNTAYNNSQYGFYLSSSSYSNLTNNTAHGNLWTGFNINTCNGNILSNNFASTNSQNGFAFFTSLHNIIQDNRAHNNTLDGFSVSSNSENNTFTNNSAYNNSENGVDFGTSSNNRVLTGNSAYNNTLFGFRIVSSSNITISGTAAYSNLASGFSFQFSANNNLTNNSAYRNSANGFAITSDCNNSILTNNSAYNNSNDGFSISGNHYNITNNLAYWNSQSGFVLPTCTDNAIANNRAYNNSYHGFYLLTNANNNNLTNNTAYNNSNHGFYVYSGSSNNNLTNNSAYNNNQYGVYLLSSANNNSMSRNNAFNNLWGGIHIQNSFFTRFTSEHFYNNSGDFKTNATGGTAITVNLSTAIFDNPAGNYSQFTNISINDSVDANTGYFINWTANTSTLPSGYNSFAGKFVNITSNASTSIDQLAWAWTDAEASGYNESRFSLWTYNASGWMQLNTTPNIASNTLSLSVLTASGVMGILQFNDTEAPRWSSNQSAIVPAYSPTTMSYFNITWTDNAAVSSAWFESNYTGTPANYSMNNITASIYNYSAIMPAGTWYWKTHANDSSNQWNTSATIVFAIAQANASSLALYINGSAADFSQNVTFNANLTCTDTVSGNHTLYENGTVLNSTNGTSVTHARTYSSVGYYNITCGLLNHQNYTGSTTHYVTADAFPPAVSLVSPADSATFYPGIVTFTFLAVDNLSSTLNCSIILDGSINQTNSSVANDTQTSFTITSIAYGQHTWSVNCTNSYNRTGSSATRQFTRTTESPSSPPPSTPGTLDVSINPVCHGFVVTVTKSGSPAEDAFVEVEVVPDGDFFSAYTDSSGKIFFSGCGMNVEVTALKSGASGVASKSVGCAPCPECSINSECPDNRTCTDFMCVAVTCPCGVIANHACTPYACCLDSNCMAGQMCRRNSCVAADCNSSDECADWQYCAAYPPNSTNTSLGVCTDLGDTPPVKPPVVPPVTPPSGGDRPTPPPSAVQCNTSDQCNAEEFCNNGQCGNVTGKCGHSVNHAWVKYECGPESDCPACSRGSSCASHQCVPDLGINAPDTGFIGEKVEVTVTEGTGVCRNCDVRWISPQGRTGTGKTGANGKLAISLDEKGTYKFTVAKDPRKIASVNALSRPGLFEGQLPTVILSEAAAPAFWLGILLLIIIGLVLYQRRRGSGKAAR